MALRRKGARNQGRGYDLFPGFTDVVEIGTGSLATVFRAREVATQRQVALKLLNVRDASPRAIESFERESMALGALSSHPNIVTLYGTFRAVDGRPVLVLELCIGAIGDRVRNGAAMPVAGAIAVGIKIAGALETAHRGGILHRDVKPQNILVTEFGEPALADFGVAMLQSATQTTAGLFDFTTLHAAPELLEGGGTSAATDVYELASSLYQLVAGQSAFRAYAGESPASVILRILRDPVRPLSAAEVPVQLSDLLLRAMAKDKAARPPTAAEFAAELAQIEVQHGWPRTQFLIRESASANRRPGVPPAMTYRPENVARGSPSTLGTMHPMSAGPPYGPQRGPAYQPAPGAASFARFAEPPARAPLPPPPPRAVGVAWGETTIVANSADEQSVAATTAGGAQDANTGEFPAVRDVSNAEGVAERQPEAVPDVPAEAVHAVEPDAAEVPADVAPVMPADTETVESAAVVQPPPDVVPVQPPPVMAEPAVDPVGPADVGADVAPVPPAPAVEPAAVLQPPPAVSAPIVPDPSSVPEPAFDWQPVAVIEPEPVATEQPLIEADSPPPAEQEPAAEQESPPEPTPAEPVPVAEPLLVLLPGADSEPAVPLDPHPVTTGHATDLEPSPAPAEETATPRPTGSYPAWWAPLPSVEQTSNEPARAAPSAGSPARHPGYDDPPPPGVPVWATRTFSSQQATPQLGGGDAPDPNAFAPQLTVRSGTHRLIVDDQRLTMRRLMTTEQLQWSQVSGFEPHFPNGEPSATSSGVLVALTPSGAVLLRATKRSGAELRRLHALLDAYRIRALGRANR